MYYKHKYFILDIDKRVVTDENGKELRLTGNAYRVLVFLCVNQSGTVTDIGDFLDHAKDYDENHLRQYRYKINSIIGHDVVKYQNSIYSIEGDVEETKHQPNSNRNTDLLHPERVQSEVNPNQIGMQKKKPKKPKKISIIPAFIAIAVMLLSFFDWSSYSYYTFLKFVVTAVTIYYAYYLYAELKEKGIWFWLLVGIAILFNPLVPIYLYDKSVWMVIDVIVIGYLITLLIKFRK